MRIIKLIYCFLDLLEYIIGKFKRGNYGLSKDYKHCGYRSNDDRIGAMNLHYLGEIYKPANAEGRKQVCDLGLLSTSPKCNVTFDSKPKAKKRKKKRCSGTSHCHWTVANQLP